MSSLTCIKYKDKTYCWNPETENIEEITTKPVSISSCPEVVINDLMKILSKKARDKEVEYIK